MFYPFLTSFYLAVLPGTCGEHAELDESSLLQIPHAAALLLSPDNHSTIVHPSASQDVAINNTSSKSNWSFQPENLSTMLLHVAYDFGAAPNVAMPETKSLDSYHDTVGAKATVFTSGTSHAPPLRHGRGPTLHGSYVEYALIIAFSVIVVLCTTVVVAASIKMEQSLKILVHMYDFRRNATSLFFRTDEAAARLAPLDGLRAVAYLSVCKAHFENPRPETNPFEGTISTGEKGVTIFFCLSGFLIPTILVSYAKKQASSVMAQFPKFLASRFCRVWPSINVFVPLGVFLYPLLPTDNRNFWSRLDGVFWMPFVCIDNFPLFQSYLCRSSQPFSHLYTVSTEMQMYMLSPFLVAVYYQSPFQGYVLALVVLLGLAASDQFVFGWDTSLCPGLVWTTFTVYIMGMLAAYSYMDSKNSGCNGNWWLMNRLRSMTLRCAAVVISSGVQVFLVIVVFMLPDHGPGRLGQGACVAVLMRMVLDTDLGGLGCYAFSSSLLYPFAALSYTGYLTSYLAAAFTRYIFNVETSPGNVFTFLLALLSNLMLAFLLSVCVERPFMSISNFSKSPHEQSKN